MTIPLAAGALLLWHDARKKSPAGDDGDGVVSGATATSGTAPPASTSAMPGVDMLNALMGADPGAGHSWRREKSAVEAGAAPYWSAVRAAWPEARVLELLRRIDLAFGLAPGAAAGACWGESHCRPVLYSQSGAGSDLGLPQILWSRWDGAQAWRGTQTAPEPEASVAYQAPHWSLVAPVIGALAAGSELARLKARHQGATYDDELIAAWWRGGLTKAGTPGNAAKAATVTTGRAKAATVAPMPQQAWNDLLTAHARALGAL